VTVAGELGTGRLPALAILFSSTGKSRPGFGEMLHV
jgi:hypothetical protein